MPALKVKSRVSELDAADKELTAETFDQVRHDSESRKDITKLFLKWYFGLIAGAFVFCAAYNAMASLLNMKALNVAHKLAIEKPDFIAYLDVSNTVSIVTTTLSSGVGFVIGYYFKNKGEN